MKKTSTLILSLALLSSAPIGVFAQNTGGDTSVGVTVGTTPPPPPPLGAPEKRREIRKEAHEAVMAIKEEAKENIGEIRAKTKEAMEQARTTASGVRGEIQKKREDMKNDVRDTSALKMKKQGEVIGKRFDAAFDRLSNIAGRIDSRIAKLIEKGADTTKAKADLVIAKTKIDTAKVKIDAAKAAIATILNDSTVPTTDSDTQIKKNRLIKEQSLIVEGVLRDAQKALAVVLSDIQQIKLPAVSATTTTTTAVSGN
jgi:hypothetical protein